jgi:uncharacterized protein
MVLRELRVNAAELLRQPGAVKIVVVDVSGTDLDVDHDALDGDIAVDLELLALNDGIAVTGQVVAPWAGPCRRCLRELSGHAAADIRELYQVELIDEDAYPIHDNQVDLAPMARQAALLELDAEHLCADDCAGLCPVCGIDRNSAVCSCDATVRDDRWSALDGLVLDEG